MNFTRLDWNLIWKSKSKFVWTRDWHVTLCDRMVPLRSDPWFEPLDFIWSGRSGFARTPSVEWVDLGHWVRIRRQTETEEKEAHLVRFPARSPASSGSGLMLATDLGASGEDGVVDEVRKESAMPCAWSTGLGVVSCDVCTRTEAF
jgi:hypothetical protein